MEVKNPLFDDSTLDYQGIPKWTLNIHARIQKISLEESSYFLSACMEIENDIVEMIVFSSAFLTHRPHYGFLMLQICNQFPVNLFLSML